MKPLVTILDDYQRIALSCADWSPVAANFEIEVFQEHFADADDLVRSLLDSEVVVAMRERTPFPASTLSRLPSLRLLVTTGIANSAIDLNAAQELGITVTATRGVSGTGARGNSLPELTLGMMVALGRGLVEADQSIRAGGWHHKVGPGLFGRTLGIVGLGRLGSRVASLAQAFEMNVLAWSPHLDHERANAVGVQLATKEQLLAESDYVSVHMALAASTRGMIGRGELALMGNQSYLINTSRGPVVDENALVDALTRKSIAGAALDVYDIEPLPADHPLRSMPNTILLPHIGYVTLEGYETYYGDAVEDILAWHASSPIRVISGK